ncbi:MAG: hypothetical protein NCW75_06200 [Phycisphaera sp.]|nr:MAG: hypothetical protein NCW75_06200 [Phycisphaera sp.]
MNDDRINDAKKKLGEINKVIAGFDDSIRAAAFEILVPLYFDDYESDEDTHRSKKDPAARGATSVPGDPATFFNKHDHDKPKDNVHLICAWIYSQYGVTPITPVDIREYANDAGLTIPDRPDNSMRTAKKDGKNLYRQKNSGWQLTVKGEAYANETYGVKKGNKPRPTGDD